MPIESVMPSNHLVLCHPLLLPPSIFPGIRVFSNELVLLIRWSKYWSFSFNISPTNEHPGRSLPWDGLVGSPCSPKDSQEYSPAPQIESINSSVVQLSHPYMTMGKTIVLIIWTFVGKVISLLCNTLSRFVIAFLPVSKCLNFMAAVTVCSDFGAQENKICHCSHFLTHLFYTYSCESLGLQGDQTSQS